MSDWRGKALARPGVREHIARVRAEWDAAEDDAEEPAEPELEQLLAKAEAELAVTKKEADAGWKHAEMREGESQAWFNAFAEFRKWAFGLSAKLQGALFVLNLAWRQRDAAEAKLRRALDANRRLQERIDLGHAGYKEMERELGRVQRENEELIAANRELDEENQLLGTRVNDLEGAP